MELFYLEIRAQVTIVIFLLTQPQLFLPSSLLPMTITWIMNFDNSRLDLPIQPETTTLHKFETKIMVIQK